MAIAELPATGMNLTLTEEQDMIRQTARDFAQNEIAKIAAGFNAVVVCIRHGATGEVRHGSDEPVGVVGDGDVTAMRRSVQSVMYCHQPTHPVIVKSQRIAVAVAVAFELAGVGTAVKRLEIPLAGVGKGQRVAGVRILRDCAEEFPAGPCFVWRRTIRITIGRAGRTTDGVRSTETRGRIRREAFCFGHAPTAAGNPGVDAHVSRVDVITCPRRAGVSANRRLPCKRVQQSG